MDRGTGEGGIEERPTAPGPGRASRRRQRQIQIRRRRITVAVIGSLVVVVAVLLVALPSSGSPHGSSPTTTAAVTATSRPGRSAAAPATAGTHATTGATFLGAQGVESRAVIAENKKRGTAAWRIASEPPTGTIQGFATQTYVARGGDVDLYVSTDAPTFRVQAYRMGWYGGDGGRLVWTSSPVKGMVQPPCPLDASTNTVRCTTWARSLVVPVTAAFVPGDYLLKLVGSTGVASYVLMTVWDPTSTATYLVMARSFVEALWNTYGGYSMYQGQGPCIIDHDSYPVCNRARVASFDRPYDTGDGAADFLGNEFPLVEYLERQGLDATYVTDVTVDEHPGIVTAHKALLSLGHDEAWSYNEREAVQQAEGKGVNVAFISAASIVRHVRLQADAMGPDQDVVDYRNPDEDPVNGHGDPMQVTGNTWGQPPTSWSQVPFVGEEYSGYINLTEPNVPFVVADASAWIFKGTGLQNGAALPGVVGSDIDHLALGGGSPSGIQVLGHSPIPVSEGYTNEGEWNGMTYSDMTYYADPTSKAGVFDAGDNDWIASMAPCPTGTRTCTADSVQKITGNLLWLFGQGPAGSIVPPTPNAASIQPAGS